MSTVAIDTRDARLEPLRGWGRYARELLGGLRTINFPVLELAGTWPGPEFLWEQGALPRLLRQSGADLVHSPNCFLPLRRPCPGVVTVHDLAFEVFPEDFARRTAWKYRTFAPRALRSAQRVICVSQFTARDAIARYSLDESKMRVVPNAPALALGDAPLPTGGPYLLGIGDLRAKKGWEVLVGAWLKLRADGLEHRLVIAGVEAGAGPALRALARNAPLELPGYVEDAALDALLRGADAFVHPSRYEGFGLVVLEAMARGTPVLCADATALPETAGGAARLFSDGDELPGALREVLGDPAPWVAAGKARAAEFSWQRTARETVAVYEELL